MLWLEDGSNAKKTRKKMIKPGIAAGGRGGNPTFDVQIFLYTRRYIEHTTDSFKQTYLDQQPNNDRQVYHQIHAPDNRQEAIESGLSGGRHKTPEPYNILKRDKHTRMFTSLLCVHPQAFVKPPDLSQETGNVD